TVPTVAERFRQAGYRTAAFTPAVTLRSEYGFGRGFEVYDQENFGHNRLSSPSLVGKVLARLEQWKGERFFIWVHLWDPHYNYNPPVPWDGYFRSGQRPAREDVQCLKWVEDPVTPAEAEWLEGQYEGEVAYTDRYLEQILAKLEDLELAPHTLVVVLADHGEAFLEHGWLGHTNRLDETLIHVPLMVRRPGEAPGVVEQAVSTASVGRSLLAWTGIPGDDFGARSTLPSPGEAPAAEPVISQTVRRGCWTAVSTTRYKYVLEHRQCRESLFDLQQDPDEKSDIAASDPGRLREMRRMLVDALDQQKSSKVPRAMLPREIVEQAEARLRSIGYVGGAANGGPGAPKNVTCARTAAPGKVDAFGDLAAQTCPEQGARRCFEKLDSELP
ncbi:MAG: sulfatase-like hydrolase/transferase, partial [Acidobacteriota bacterium]|nr:sulfatase-like hydrolase/transferase [Acidobacteriota bacterium]